jgi:hypothetical protein
MTHHDQIITIRKVSAGSNETRNLGGDAYAKGVIPQDGFIITVGAGEVSSSIYLSSGDIRKAQKSKLGEVTTAISWKSKPRKTRINND